MNILVVSHDYSSYRFRPDSTLTRNQEIYYLPDFVESVSFSPILHFRCSSPGKSVEERFAHRYVDSFGYGILLYPELSGRITENREFISSALDFTSIIPLGTHPISDYGSFPSFKPARVTVNGHLVAENPPHPSYDRIREMISGITRYVSTRTGDFISYELLPPMPAEKGKKIDLWVGETLSTSVLIL